MRQSEPEVAILNTDCVSSQTLGKLRVEPSFNLTGQLWLKHDPEKCANLIRAWALKTISELYPTKSHLKMSSEILRDEKYYMKYAIFLVSSSSKAS